MEFKATLDVTTTWKIMKRWVLLLIVLAFGLTGYAITRGVIFPVFEPFLALCVGLFILTMNARVEFGAEAMVLKGMVPLIGLSVRYEDMISVGKGMPLDSLSINKGGPKATDAAPILKGVVVYVETKKKGIVYFTPKPADVTDTVIANIQAHGVPFKEGVPVSTKNAEEFAKSISDLFPRQ